MQIFIAKSAGFCFGVQNAVQKAQEVAEKGEKAATLGPIIHNRQVIEDLKSKGIDLIEDISKIEDSQKIIIRSHGISKQDYDSLIAKNAIIVDATCPYVKNIHKIVQEKYSLGYKIIIIGDREHPEIKGVNGWCDNSAIIINTVEDVNNLPKNIEKVCIVAQTTFNEEKWRNIICNLIGISKEMLIFNTICNATQIRQTEAKELSKKVDVMIVVGGKESSNTRKLYEICSENCPLTLFVESVDEIDFNSIKNASSIGITAGASTPDYVIKEVVDKLNSISKINNEQNIKVKKENKTVEKENIIANENSEMDAYFIGYNEVYEDSIVKGTVLLVNDKEVFFDIGYKSDAILPIEEASNFPVNLKEKFKVGDVYDLQVIKLNDGEGNVLVSRKALEKDEFINKLYEYKEKEDYIDVIVTKENKGGLECQYGDVKAFMPVSQVGLSKDEDIKEYLGKKLKVKIIDIKEKKNDVEIVVSRKDIIKQEKDKRVKEFFENIKEGQALKGTVKSMIESGVFVSVGDVDVFIPISEISWKRIKTPKEVLNEKDIVEFIVIKVNREDKKITGSIKRAGKEPWEEFIEKYKVDDIVDVKVLRFAEFGAFAEIIPGVDGLIHISKLSEKRINKPQEVVKIGQIVKAKIINIDTASKRVSLSLKDVE
ncbi:bifunctional 4-hydroxy-3-methylbut-2-enyl diphosphate reductase/30S ribosomal protein S1 [Caloramator sp. E03]|uniref:bifunctional 4-hydroxy-3-methylbut-2-enyl diphosphate reductase/30S ribosomal protein S1 n=1 Tax=Caloramator sp. E03 TaxID=2576307 RepID=UPI001110E71E|nr:bifunctional 4-hydroxy-3-methylbut-2-enyl diphosphate reductase/30S ribosomal protein S1 [Caloramator sp. E03]QCX32616.1 bifunctional 4-hydroxy-3-methylbut-2-enyl diphosphate reductase/30S ribosomal protein S1 [Caloramator sp. E03]